MPARLPLPLIALLAACLAGCASPNRVTLQSTSGPARLEATFPTVVYAETGQTGADILLTDLTLDELDPGADPGELSGRIVRISMVVRPKPGATPIDPTAANATVQYLILSRGAIGLYSGGAFLNPGKPLAAWAGLGTESMTAKIRGGTLRLTAATERFENLLGPARMEAQFEALPDETLARRAAAKLDAVLAELYRSGE